MYYLKLSKVGAQKPRQYINPESSLTSWYQAIFRELYSRVFIITKKGYIGLAPQGAKIGDIVCVIFGGDVPVLLRPDGDGFILVSESYIHGLMEGEAMKLEDIGLSKITLK